MPRRLTPRSTLDNLKKEAKRWLKALRADVDDARERLQRALPNAPALPTLRDVQHALAIEHGFPGWTELKDRISKPAATEKSRDEIVNWFFENACPDHHVRGPSAHAMARHTAMRILEQYPEIANESIHTAVVCGNVDLVRRILADRPEAAVERSSDTPSDRSGVGGVGDLFRDIGPKGWDPLLYLCFTRLPLDAANDNAVTIAKMLLDYGANANSFFMAGSSRYTSFVGVVGEGEEDRPPHPRRDELARLLLDHGAEPYDIQVVYNTHFHGDVLWLLKLMSDYSVKAGRKADWDDPYWSMLNMGGYGSGARWFLSIAAKNNDFELAEWILSHGGSPNAPPGSDARLSKRSLHEEAVLSGNTEMADLLLRYGATPSAVALEGIDKFALACFRLDRDAAQSMAREHPEYLRSTKPIFAAAKRDRTDVVELLLDLGTSPDIEDEKKQRALHIAAYDDAVHVGELLIARGAEIDPVEMNWGNTPLDAAAYAQSQRMIDLLGKVSRDVWNLTFTGKVERLREIFATEPELARVSSKEYGSPLLWLPDDEMTAMEIVELFLSNGADASVTNKERQTAADRAERRGMVAVAKRLRRAESGSQPTLDEYEEKAEALLDAYRTGTPEAMERHWRLTWHRRNWSAMRTYTLLDLGRSASGSDADADISLADAQHLVAHEHGFKSWQELEEFTRSLPEGKAMIAATPVGFFTIGERGKKEIEGNDRNWDVVINTMRERRIPGLAARGQMTDAILERISELDHITTLDLSNSRAVTDRGLSYLARMPQLEEIDLSGCTISDRGLEVLRELPELKTFRLYHQRGITDSGVANLAPCTKLEFVTLMGTATGDGLLRALTGKPKLRHVETGNLVTDAGLTLLHEFPIFKTWQNRHVSISLTDYSAEPNYLMVRGWLTDDGMARLVGLDGLFGLSIGSSDVSIGGAGLSHVARLPNLGSLAFDATDETMPFIAALPHLRFLMCQDTEAGDDGFVALSRSQTIERIWGRRCHNLRTRGFVALSKMPALRGLSVSCLNVDDSGLASLPNFPALTELMPMDVPDDGYRHIGKCKKLESLVLMYCRETTDISTSHIAGLPSLKKYFASYNRITDYTPQILSKMDPLEEVTFSACSLLTSAGVSALARLPRLRELDLGGMPNVTEDVVRVFPSSVHVKYSP
ncbi:MAG: ankyrin repeat domain-containing protein [Gemmatimonadaceae bacterium]